MENPDIDSERDYEGPEDSETRNLEGDIEDLEREILEQAARVDFGPDDVTPWVLEFRVVGTPQILHAPVEEVLIMGRSDMARNIEVDVDLTPAGGQGLGVSRRHAKLIARDNRVTVEDLGSSNGTYINGNQLDVLRPHRIREGDILQLGNLKLQVHFVIKPSSNEDTLHGHGNTLEIPKFASDQRLLVLDDNEDVCRVLRFVTMRAGFEPIIVHTLADAIATVDQQVIHGILLEIRLEDANGLDLISYLNQQWDNRIPIIAMGSDSSGYLESQATKAGANVYITKPLAIDKLLDGLHHIFAMMLP